MRHGSRRQACRIEFGSAMLNTRGVDTRSCRTRRTPFVHRAFQSTGERVSGPECPLRDHPLTRLPLSSRAAFEGEPSPSEHPPRPESSAPLRMPRRSRARSGHPNALRYRPVPSRAMPTRFRPCRRFDRTSPLRAGQLGRGVRAQPRAPARRMVRPGAASRRAGARHDRHGWRPSPNCRRRRAGAGPSHGRSPAARVPRRRPDLCGRRAGDDG